MTHAREKRLMSFHDTGGSHVEQLPQTLSRYTDAIQAEKNSKDSTQTKFNNNLARFWEAKSNPQQTLAS
jgi:hypothetical protein